MRQDVTVESDGAEPSGWYYSPDAASPRPLVVASLDERVAALVVQVPAPGAAVSPDDPDGPHRESLRQKVRSGAVEPSADEIRGPMPVVWDDQVRRPSALQPETAFRWFTGYGTRSDTNWTNEVTVVRPTQPVQWSPGLCASDVSCPATFVVSPEDEMPRSSPAVARDAYERLAGPKEWVALPGGLFGLLYYPSETFEKASAAQSRFLTASLLTDDE
jgi:hypothetical protein